MLSSKDYKYSLNSWFGNLFIEKHSQILIPPSTWMNYRIPINSVIYQFYKISWLVITLPYRKKHRLKKYWLMTIKNKLAKLWQKSAFFQVVNLSSCKTFASYCHSSLRLLISYRNSVIKKRERESEMKKKEQLEFSSCS